MYVDSVTFLINNVLVNSQTSDRKSHKILDLKILISEHNESIEESN